jgi:hypothetical protein
MVALPSTGASRYHNCCVDGGTSPENFGSTHVYYILSSNYVDILSSTNNKAKYKILGILLLTPSICQIFSRPHFTPIKMTGIFDLLMDET